MSKVVVVGVDHFLQNLNSVCETAEGRASEDTQKLALKSVLQNLIREHTTELIAEEAKLAADCLGKILADEYGCKYCNLTMPWEKRHQHGIGKDYHRAQETRQKAYRVFEEFMFETVQRNRSGLKSILVICGLFHINNLARLFGNETDEVLVESTARSDWYRGRPMESDGKVIGFYAESFERATGKQTRLTATVKIALAVGGR